MIEGKVNCKSVMHHICDSLGEDLQSDKCIAIKEHLDGCTDCKNYFNSIEKTISFYRMYNAEVPDGAHERLLKILDLDNI
ncbi:MAG: hypothetical protein K8H86_07865 [Ignavibacteriaceae bacterium]|nr:hypothetical protein [Ignavibacteriaceae bacterium]